MNVRPIKFRAWLNSTRKMYNVIRLDVGFGRYEFDEANYPEERNIIIGTECVGATIMQYTGIKDKNGVEIYEGDILRYKNKIYEVTFDAESAQFYARTETLNAYNCEMTIGKNSEVIGNVWETPEALKEGGGR